MPGGPPPGPAEWSPAAGGGGNGDPAWLRTEITKLNEQVRALATTVSNQQSVFVDIAGARTAELQVALREVAAMAAELRGETDRLRQLQDAISHHLHDLVLEVVQPELRAQLGQGIPESIVQALAPELNRALNEWLPQIVAANVAPEVRKMISEWLPVMVADTVQPEVRQAMIDRLPDITATAVQPEVRRILAERLPHLVADTVQPEIYQALADRLPIILSGVVTPEVREVLAAHLPSLVAETVQPEIRAMLDQRLPGIVAQVVNPEMRRVLSERLPSLVAETVQPEVRQTLADRLPHLVSETVRPEVRSTLEERLPSVVAQIVSPEVRRVLAEKLPSLVAETVQPEIRQVLVSRLPATLAEVVSPAVGELLAQRLPGMLSDTVTPELSVTLAETEAAAAELRHEAAKLRGLREVVAERLPESVMSAIEPHLHDVLAVQFPRLVGEMVEPVVRSVLTAEMPGLVAAAVQPGVAASLNERVPALVAESVRPELRQIVVDALQEKLPGVVGEAVRPELRDRLAEILPAVIVQAVTPELTATLVERLPSVVADVVTPELTISLAEVEGTAAEMRAETARLRGLREVVTERLPEAVMGAVRSVLEEGFTTRLPEALSRLLEPAVQHAVSTPLSSVLGRELEPALTNVLGRELPAVIQRTIAREVQLGLGESLPALVAQATEPGMRAALARFEASASGVSDMRRDLFEQLTELTKDAASAPYARLEASAAVLDAEAQHLRELREEVLRQLPSLIDEAVAAPLARFESSAAQLRGEAERMRSLRSEGTGEHPETGAGALPAPLGSDVTALVQDAIAAAMADVRGTSGQLKAEAERLRSDRGSMEAGLLARLPQLVEQAVSGALAAGRAAPADAGTGAAPTAASIAAAADPAVGADPSSEAAADPPLQRVEPVPADPPLSSADDITDADPQAAADPAAPVQAAAPASDPAPAPPPPAPPSPAPIAVVPPAPPSASDTAVAAALAPPANGARSSEPAPGEPNSEACVLPGLVVGPTLARAMSEAVTRSRLRRRRRRRAGPPAAGLHRPDPFTSELTRRLEWYALARRQETNGAAPFAPGVIPAGERDGTEVVLPLGAQGAFSLLGPRAKEVARALVLTFLAHNPPHAARAIVIGNLLPPSTSFPELGRAKDVGSVLGGLTAEAERRRALFASAGVSNIEGYRSARPDDPVPTVLVVVAEMTTLEAGRLGELLDEGADLGIVGVLVDAPLEGIAAIRLQGSARVAGVSPESAAADLPGARLFTVDREPSAELLDVLASARIDIEPEPVAAVSAAPFEVVEPAHALISVRLLGGYRIDVSGREVRSGLRGKAKELLAFYLLHPEGTTLEEATEALWPEADARRGSEWFWTALGNLRSRLRSATENKELKVIEREGDRYRIEPLFEVDLWRFEAALARAGTQSTAAGAQSADPSWAAALQQAADAYSGELLAGMTWPWAEVPREDLRGRAVDVLVSLAATRLVNGDIRSALDALERAVQVDPVAEQLYRRIMRLHAKMGRPDQADASFRTLVARLGEIDLEPSGETEKLHAELCGTS